MHPNWIKFLDEINSEIIQLDNIGCDIIYFRGHSRDSFELLPTLLRYKNEDIQRLETVLFYEFVSMAGAQIKNENSWDTLFTMRHYGVPTRLLDWTTSFAFALYFAIANKNIDKPHIWILNPFKLNLENKQFAAGLLNPNYDIVDDYVKMFINPQDHKKVKRSKYPVALYPSRNNPRIYAQQGVFTIHGTLSQPLDKLLPDCLKKIYIPTDCLPDAENFLSLAGVHEYSAYPDFTGLANYLKSRHKL